jgi:GNAT superfamily N-acetyltransferase
MIEVHPLTPEREVDYLKLFDGTAFSDNPKWGSCYCQCYYEDHSAVRWSERTAAQNRALACERIRGRAMQGLLAYSDGVPVGWCNAAPRRLLIALHDEPTPDADTLGAIVCFLVEPSQRGRGVARQLLEAACDGLKQQGLRIVEANPPKDASTAAENHSGPLRLYLSAGFAVHREDDDGGVYVRRAL